MPVPAIHPEGLRAGRLSPALAALCALLVLAPVPASAQTMVRDVKVSADIAAIQNARAAAYWTNVGPDIENAIVARLVGRAADDGVRIEVDINEFELGNQFEEAFNLADSTLSGVVRVSTDGPMPVSNSYNLTVGYNQSLAFLPEGYDVAMLSRDSHEYYTGMVDAFADAVVRGLD